MLSWFDAREAKNFGGALAEYLMEKIPADSDYRSKKELSARRAALNKTAARVQEFRKDRTLNVYQKAQLGNVFKWTLREAKYDTLFVNEMTDFVVNQF